MKLHDAHFLPSTLLTVVLTDGGTRQEDREA